MKNYHIYCDGSHSPKLKQIGVGGSIYLDDELIAEFSHHVDYHEKTLFHEEYAINHALCLAKKMGLDEVTVFTDSHEFCKKIHTLKAGLPAKTNPYIKKTLKYMSDFKKINFCNSNNHNHKFKRVHLLSRRYIDGCEAIKRHENGPENKENVREGNDPTFNGKPVTWTQLLALYKIQDKKLK